MTPRKRKGGVPTILEAVAEPNPQRGAHLRVAFKLEADAERVTLRLYSRAMVTVSKHRFTGGYSSGWNRISVGLDGAPANGVYFIVLDAENEDGMSERKIVKVLYLN